MKTNNVSFEMLVKQLVTVFKSANMLADYNSDSVQHEIFSGWTGGSMSPVTRPAYIQDFGEDVLERAEMEARKQIEAEQTEFEKGEYFAAAAAADELRERGGLPGVGAYVWALSDGGKCCDGVPGCIYDLVCYDMEMRQNLCRVAQVEHVPEAFWGDHRAADDLVQQVGADSFPGGVQSFPTPQGKRNITNVCLCVSDSGKYCFIDSEGYSYARYILFGEDFKTLFAEEITAEQSKKEARDKAAKEAEEAAKAARQADYLARCERWAGLMVPVAKYEEAEKAAGWNDKKAARKLQSVRRSNILAMFKAAFPGVKVSIRKNNGWGKDWMLTYQDGPTLEKLKEITDFELFQDTRDVHDDFADYWTSEKLEFAAFAKKYMGNWGGNGIAIYREKSDEMKADLLAKVCEVVPGVEFRPLTEAGYDVEEYLFTRADLDGLAEKFGLSLDVLCGNGSGWSRTDWTSGASLWVSSLISNIFDALSFEGAKVEKKCGSPILSAPGAGETTAGEAGAPDGLQLEEIPGGVAVVGDSRTTYRHRKEIKANGCVWNREAKRWEATTAEAVAAVKRWFGVSDAVEDQTQKPAEEETTAPEKVQDAQEVEAEEVETVQTVAATVDPTVKTEAIPHYCLPEKLEDFPTRSLSEFFVAHPERRGNNLLHGKEPTEEQQKEQAEMIEEFFGMDIVQIHLVGDVSYNGPYRDGSSFLGAFFIRGHWAEFFRSKVKDPFPFPGENVSISAWTEKELKDLVLEILKAGKKYVLIVK